MKRGMVTIDRERCKGCRLCVHACPFGVLIEDTVMNIAGIYPIRADKRDLCTACASCYRVCPDSAITVYELEGES